MKQGTAGSGSGQQQRVFTGTVTKFHENFGFVDEDVFFQTSVVKGQTPKVNVCTKALETLRFRYRKMSRGTNTFPTNYFCYSY